MPRIGDGGDVAARLKKVDEAWTEERLFNRLRRQYPERQSHWLVLRQVALSPGYALPDSYIDAVVLNLWPSGGLKRMAFEIKVSRSDFLRELRDRRKNAWARLAFHKFWYLAAPGVIKPTDDLDGLGWVEPEEKTGEDSPRLIVKSKPQENPFPMMGLGLLTSLCRRSFEAGKEMRRG